MTQEPMALRALRSRWTDLILADHDLMCSAVRIANGPVHLIDPDRFTANAQAFAATFLDAGVRGAIFYGKKANKAAAFGDAIGELVACNRRCPSTVEYGIDVASVGELRQALATGVPGPHLLVTGPHKTTALLSLSIRHDALITVDSPAELTAVADLSHGLATRVMLRVRPKSSTSRFGMTPDELNACEIIIRDRVHDIVLTGYSFHLDGYDVAARRRQAQVLLQRIDSARQTGMSPDTLSIGGGLPISYVSQEHWARFRDPSTFNTFHADKSFDGFYPYHSAVAGADALRTLLLDETGGSAQSSLAAQCRAASVTVAVEPGRALLDQAGLSIFPIVGVKDRGYGIITVAGTSLSLSEQWFNSEFLPDPELVPLGAPHAEGSFPAAVGAATCLESDMLTWRIVNFPQRPTTGDLLIYHNTAGYQMDSNESWFHDTPPPPKLVVTHRDGKAEYSIDRAFGADR